MLRLLRQLHHFLPLAGEKNQAKRWLLIAAFIAGILCLSALLVYLLTNLQKFINVPLEKYAFQAYLLVFVATLLSSATVLIPAPGVAVTLAAASRWDPFWVAVAASLGGSLGELVGYLVGYVGSAAVLRKRWSGYRRAELWTRRYGIVGVFFFALFPLMLFDIVGIVSGALRLPVWRFLLAVWAGRVPRSLFEVYVGVEWMRHIFPFLFQ